MQLGSLGISIGKGTAFLLDFLARYILLRKKLGLRLDHKAWFLGSTLGLIGFLFTYWLGGIHPLLALIALFLWVLVYSNVLRVTHLVERRDVAIIRRAIGGRMGYIAADIIARLTIS